MKDINLLPKIKKDKNILEVSLNILIVFLVLILAVSAAVSFFVYRSMNYLQYSLSEIEKINFDLNTLAIKLRPYKTFNDQVAYKSDIIKTITENEILWSDKFYSLSTIIPDNVYITKFSGTSDNVNNEISLYAKGGNKTGKKLKAFSIEGYSSDYTNVSKFLIDIKTMPEISDPWVASINEVNIAGINMLFFRLDAYWDIDFLIKDIKPDKDSVGTEQGNSEIDNSLMDSEIDLNKINQ